MPLKRRLGQLRDFLTPSGVVALRDARPWADRYGGRPLRVAPALASSRLRLVPPTVDLRAGPVVDVGANVGDWTQALLTVVSTAEVVAVEPFPDAAARLRERFGNRVTVVEAAISNRVGSATLHVTEHSHNNSLQAPLDMNAEYRSGWTETGSISVPTTTLDALLDGRAASLVKIDVQGGERLAIAGGQQALRAAQAVLIEMTTRSHYEGDALLPELDGLLTGLGFRLAGLSEPWIGAASGEALWFDACYVNSSSSTRN